MLKKKKGLVAALLLAAGAAVAGYMGSAYVSGGTLPWNGNDPVVQDRISGFDLTALGPGDYVTIVNTDTGDWAAYAIGSNGLEVIDYSGGSGSSGGGGDPSNPGGNNGGGYGGNGNSGGAGGGTVIVGPVEPDPPTDPE